eukprot:5349819-Amphidinium_carterae.1
MMWTPEHDAGKGYLAVEVCCMVYSLNVSLMFVCWKLQDDSKRTRRVAAAELGSPSMAVAQNGGRLSAVEED